MGSGQWAVGSGQWAVGSGVVTGARGGWMAGALAKAVSTTPGGPGVFATAVQIGPKMSGGFLLRVQALRRDGALGEVAGE
ncbi:hypothetical protein [Phragmitibacter flavus]|uniref:hypothetical protein n=1 Tax=Phragmitibacter flavus TaxID=2576071 RepID=UPI00140BCF20|nr:hypothetical protein [Phragmitibacter flavus]